MNRLPPIFLSSLLLVACGGSDTQVETTPLPPPVEQPVVNYNGPAPATTDVQNFKLAVWDNLASGALPRTKYNMVIYK